MNILALNTAFAYSQVAVDFGGKKSYLSVDSSAKQSENVLVCIDKILNDNNKHINDIDCLSVVVGPGSFTGIRIGVGLCKGMKVAISRLKLISICSLDLMAYIYSKNAQSDFYCVLNALSGNIFVCKYDKTGNRLDEPKMLTDGDLDVLKKYKCVGLKGENLEMTTSTVEFSSETLLKMSILKAEKNEFVEENELLPIYLRKSQAEIGLELKDANKKN